MCIESVEFLKLHLCCLSVWQKLEEENQDFFKAYHLRLILKDQIMKFNKLLQTQAELMRQISSAPGAASVPIPNGSHNTLCKRPVTGLNFYNLSVFIWPFMPMYI